MADVRKFFDKDLLYDYDLDGREVTVTIDRVEQGEFGNWNTTKARDDDGNKKKRATKKPVVYFVGKAKALGLNITNARTIAALLGTFEVEKWKGKKITLYPTTTTFGKETVGCIRVKNRLPDQ